MSSPTEYKLETMEPRTTHIDEAQSNSGEKGGEVATGYPEATPEEERELLRRINLTILPLMCFVFFLQYLDKQSLSYASVFGLIPDLHLTSVQLSWTGSIFYVGQLVAQYPFIYVMSRLHLTKFVGATILWITMNGLAQTVGCFLMYGIGKNDKLALAPWRTLFLVCGAITTFAGILFYFYMPSGSNDAWFLTERQKQILSMRMAKDREGGDKTSFSSGQLKEALLDVKTWLVFWFGVLVTMQAPVLAFASLVISNIGYDRFETMLYMSPSGIVQIH
ncbi:threonine ammonia-lyase precursor [Purpureocillium lavendulum]|uniref:Threonine ammonia-lyase n=1 Tax=Purpureocillium lavendulum TaxID=1247861 RepID=A0AB34FWM8_9HYPO|nr:threonine ammonia-lyase precursor [Purpureocillium lavendulum]